MENGILCHGRHLLANNWELHQFGDKEGHLGQITKTCLLTYNEKPKIVVFGTGASEKDGILESNYTIQYMMDNFGDLKYFPQFEGISLDELKDTMHKISVAETTSQNTYQELQRAGEIFDNSGVSKVMIVSNPDHSPRCGQLAHQVYQEGGIASLGNFFICPSEVGYNGTTQTTSKIIEMPHRGDEDPRTPNLTKWIGKYFGLSLDNKIKFNEKGKKLIKRLK